MLVVVQPRKTGKLPDMTKMLLTGAYASILQTHDITEPVHEISNNVVCATRKASDQPSHMRSLIRAFDGR